MRPAVEDVAHDVQAVDGEALDEGRERHDEVVRGARGHDRCEDRLVVLVADALLVARGVHELVEDVGELGLHGLAHLGSGVLARDPAREPHEAVERNEVPALRRKAGRPHAIELLVGVVHEGPQLRLAQLVELAREEHAYLLADDAGAVVEYVQEGLVLAMDVAHEVLGSTGQREDRLEVDDLAHGRLAVGEVAGEQPAVPEVEVASLFAG